MLPDWRHSTRLSFISSAVSIGFLIFLWSMHSCDLALPRQPEPDLRPSGSFAYLPIHRYVHSQNRTARDPTSPESSGSSGRYVLFPPVVGQVTLPDLTDLSRPVLEKAKRAERARGNGTSTNEKTSFLADMDPTPSTLELSRSLSNVTISTPSLGTTVPSGEDPTNLSADTPSSPEESTSVKPLSEKAKGKRREGANEGLSDGEPDDDELDQELEQIRVGGLGSGGFVPTQEWVTSWQKGSVHPF